MQFRFGLQNIRNNKHFINSNVIYTVNTSPNDSHCTQLHKTSTYYTAIVHYNLSKVQWLFSSKCSFAICELLSFVVHILDLMLYYGYCWLLMIMFTYILVNSAESLNTIERPNTEHGFKKNNDRIQSIWLIFWQPQ